ncbi:MAG: CRISPR-associated endonuclease Cas2 [Candidatus Taylorbacteria bacterium]|nr:CRISPR-associated endonuclease Cas2 [Candidatus Taylorbacteria bacterium]
MKYIEVKRKRERLGNIQKAVLSSVALAGVLAVALIAPNAIQALKPFHRKAKPRTSTINRSVQRLIEQKLLMDVVENGRRSIQLTAKGERLLVVFEENNFTLRRPKRWDGKWRLIIFDIKEQRKLVREKLRNTLISIGFFRLQDSVWVYPFDCEDFMNLIKTDLQADKDILYVVAESIEGDRRLKTFFGLS